ncbi:NnrU protein [Mariprofundus micogutta]|uniref:NnrU protein n=1 Tax=Mariprofundus micogutta TaxID=1921010 RepID=A0A1L8CNJ7_9PROT|nr:NnrU family protein [Mariprofundus micogutta]GAV20485.1 NnrU protein [Mariprofundus micogutta]
MNTLRLGLIIFFAIHLLPSVKPLYAALKNKLGEKAFKGLFALVSLAGMVLIVMGMGEAEFVDVYEPPSWGRHVTSLLMLFALYGVIAAQMKFPTSIKTVSAHPMLWGITAWSTGHLLANGDLASVTMFGAFLIYSLFAMFSANQRGARPSAGPLTFKGDGIVLVITAVIYTLIMFFHASIAGVPIME